VAGDLFGVKFPALDGEQRYRLQRIILKHVTFAGSHSERSAFRIVK
jgi:hypothetical protein